MAANRLQRWAIILATYTYEIQYKPTAKHGNADALSSLPASDDQDYSLASELNCIHSLKLEQLPLRATNVAQATEVDAVLTRVYHFIQQGWPKSKSNLDKALHPYFVRRLRLTLKRARNPIEIKGFIHGNSTILLVFTQALKGF